MARNRADAQPARVLTDEEWSELHKLIQEAKTVSVEKLCGAYGVSRARYYRKFPVGDAAGRQGHSGHQPEKGAA